jgi:hypothetical protein
LSRVLLDEGVPRLLGEKLRGLGIDAGDFPDDWRSLADAELLGATESAGFSILITCDKNMPFQRPLRASRLAVLVLPRSKLHHVLDDAHAIADRLLHLEPGRYAVLGREGSLPDPPRKPL